MLLPSLKARSLDFVKFPVINIPWFVVATLETFMYAPYEFVIEPVPRFVLGTST